MWAGPVWIGDGQGGALPQHALEWRPEGRGGMSHPYLGGKGQMGDSKGQVPEALCLACMRTAEDSVVGAKWLRRKIRSERYCREK